MIKDFRTAMGWSQRELAEALGLPTGTVARWETGKLKIQHRRMLELALRALKVSHYHARPGALPVEAFEGEKADCPFCRTNDL